MGDTSEAPPTAPPPPSPGDRAAFYKRLQDCQASIRTVQADAARHGAQSVKPQSLIAKIAPQLAVFGLSLEYDLEELRQDRYLMKKRDRDGQAYEEMWFHTAVIVRFHLTDVETGFTVCRRAAGASVNKDGDGAVHAQSQAMKQFLLKQFQIDVGSREDIGPPGEGKSGNGRRPKKKSSAPEPDLRLIEEAQMIPFHRARSGDTVRGDTGEYCRICPDPHDVHGASWPMIVLKPGQEEVDRWTCVHKACGYNEYPKPDPEPSSVETEEKKKPPPEEDQSWRTEVNDLMRKAGVYAWQARALALAEDFPEDKEEWKPEQWKRLAELLRGNPAKAIRAALQACADPDPASTSRIEYLRTLYSEGYSFSEQAEAEAAIKSGWREPVEELIARHEGEAESPELALGAEANE